MVPIKGKGVSPNKRHTIQRKLLCVKDSQKFPEVTILTQTEFRVWSKDVIFVVQTLKSEGSC